MDREIKQVRPKGPRCNAYFIGGPWAGISGFHNLARYIDVPLIIPEPTNFEWEARIFTGAPEQGPTYTIVRYYCTGQKHCGKAVYATAWWFWKRAVIERAGFWPMPTIRDKDKGEL